jgi:hypothetical protein
MPFKMNFNGGVISIGSVVLALMAIGALFWRVSAVEADQEKTDDRLKYLEENQKVLDRNQREAAADSKWVLEGLHGLLDAANVPRTERPDVKPSEMKKPD